MPFIFMISAFSVGYILLSRHDLRFKVGIVFLFMLFFALLIGMPKIIAHHEYVKYSEHWHQKQKPHNVTVTPESFFGSTFFETITY